MNQVSGKPKNIVVLVSGNGSNLQAIIDHLAAQSELGYVSAVISDKQTAFGLERARKHSIDDVFIDPKAFESRELFDRELAKVTDSFEPNLVILAGFMRILSTEFVDIFNGRLINIHPSLLPKYPGLNTHARAIENNEVHHGTSVHFVTEELDGGPIIAQAKLNLIKGEAPKDLATRIQALEYKLYPWVIDLYLKGEIAQDKQGVLHKNKLLASPLIL